MSAFLVKSHPKLFPNAKAAKRFCSNIWFPKSGRWLYQMNAKSGNTFMLNLLFEIEFGVRFTAKLSSPSNQHPDFALFQLCNSGLFANVEQQFLSCGEFDGLPGLRLATVRNPFLRAVSSFLYFCRSHSAGDMRFVHERIRINALTGFDWDLDSNTALGFLKFLRYIFILQQESTIDQIDAHWLPQVRHIEPSIYKPDIIGRTEDLSGFAIELSARFERPLCDRTAESLRRNAAGSKGQGLTDQLPIRTFYEVEEAVHLVRRIYLEDFECFGYSLEVDSLIK